MTLFSMQQPIFSNSLLKHIGQFIFASPSFESYCLAIVTIKGDQIKLPASQVHRVQDTGARRLLSSGPVQMPP